MKPVEPGEIIVAAIWRVHRQGRALAEGAGAALREIGDESMRLNAALRRLRTRRLDLRRGGPRGGSGTR